MDSRRKELEQAFDSGTFSQALQNSRAQPSGARALSGGVPLSGSTYTRERGQGRRQRPGQAPGTVQAPAASIQQLPPLHLGRGQHMNAQFMFQYQPDMLSHIDFSQAMPPVPMPFGLQQPSFDNPQSRTFNNYAQHNFRRDGGRYVHNRRR